MFVWQNTIEFTAGMITPALEVARNFFLVLFQQSSVLREPMREVRLRHAVWVAEKSGCILQKIAENCRNSLTLALKLDRRKCPA